MIKIGVILNFTEKYQGGINYLKNLFFAVNSYWQKEIQFYLFVPSNLDIEYLSLFRANAIIIKTKILQRKAVPWFINKVIERISGYNPFYFLLLQKYKIDVISHSNYIYPGIKVKSINWIPDFQYLYYPNLWTKKQLKSIAVQNYRLVKKSNRIIVSSYDALHDFISVFPQYKDKARVLHFVSQPNIPQSEGYTSNISKYSDTPFFYLPNQFWEHKNHLTVFKAVKLLKDRGIFIKLLISGLMSDFRNKNIHINNLQQYVLDNGLNNYIKFLGLISYQDVLLLIKESLAVINPSFFEGWSSTVEEAKSLGKTIVLSDIPVHREQNPATGYYFKADDEHQLAELLNKLMNAKMTNRYISELELNQDLINRTKKFAEKYISIILNREIN